MTMLQPIRTPEEYEAALKRVQALRERPVPGITYMNTSGTLILALFLSCFLSVPILAQIRNQKACFTTSSHSSSDSLAFQSENQLWLMGSLSGSLYIYPIDPTYIEDFGFWGYALKFGGVWHNRILQFDYHSETEYVFNLNPHRYDYALLYGISHREGSIFDNLMVGISIINYLRRGAQLTPPSSPNFGDQTYQALTGNVIGLAGSAEFYLTPIKYWGLFGMGMYGCLNSGMSYVVLEFSILELNLPITLK